MVNVDFSSVVEAAVSELEKQYQQSVYGPYTYNEADRTCVGVDGDVNMVALVEAILVAAGCNVVKGDPT